MSQESVLNTKSLAYAVASDANSKFRKAMEDAHVAITPFSSPGSGYFAVFDGHAGPACAQQSAEKLHTILENQLTVEKRAPYALRNAFVEMDKQFSNIANSGCTACVALVNGENLTVANVGDTRTVLCRGGKALRLSYDHKGNDENEKRRITNFGGLLINNRVNGVLAVTRALGDLYMKDYVIGDPYTTETELDSTDEFFIVACDGVWDVCSDQQAVDIVRGFESPQEGADELIGVAIDRGSMDNLTVMVVKL